MMTPDAARSLLRKALAQGAVRISVHGAEQIRAAGFEAGLIFAELDLAASRGSVGRNDANPKCALAYGDVLTMSFARDGERTAAIVVTVWVQER